MRMTDKINGITSEEIKKGLECCFPSEDPDCFECPYEGMENCFDVRINDILAYIQRLERERDAAVNALCEVHDVLFKNGWAGTTLCMAEVRSTINDGLMNVICAREVE